MKLGTIGNIVSPFIYQFCLRNLKINQMYLVGTFGLFGAVASIFIKETKGCLINDYIIE